MLSINAFLTWRSSAVLLACLLLAAGCSAIKYGMHLAGPPTEDARYVLKKVPTITMVKDEPDPFGADVESDEVGGMIETQLTAYELVTVIPAAKVAEYREQHLADFNLMTPAQIGKAVGAKQVIYVKIVDSRLDRHATQDMAKGRIVTTVSVFNTDTDKPAWPTDGSDGVGVSYETPLLRLTDRTTLSNIEREMHAGVAEDIGKLFRSYKPD